MVSRLFIAGRYLAVLSLLLCLISLVAFPQIASAKNPYAIRDGHEGDPGDGVLNPSPVLDPDPVPKGDIFPVYIFYMIPVGNHQFIPVIQYMGFPGASNFGFSPFGIQIAQEGRWHHAP